MARSRFRPGRILVVLVLFVLFCLLMELNRFLPGGWPGGGGDGGMRRAGTLDRGDDGGADEVERPGPATLAEPQGRPPITLPRTGVLIEVRARAGDYLDKWSFGQGEGGPETPLTPRQHGRHVAKDKQLGRDGFRVRTGDGALYVQTRVTDAEPGHWIVVLPDAIPPRVRIPDQIEIRVTPRAGTSLDGRAVAVTVVAPGAAAVTHEPDTDGVVRIKAPQGPVQIAPVVDGRAGTPRWIGRRANTAIDLPAPPEPARELAKERILMLPSGEAGFAARFPIPGSGGAAEPEHGISVPSTDAGGGRTLRVPRDVPIEVLIDQPESMPYALKIDAGRGAESVTPAARIGNTVELRVRGPDGKPVAGAVIVAGIAAAPFLTVRHTKTDGAGKATLAGIPPGALGLFIAAPEAGLATQRVLLDVPRAGPMTVELGAGLPMAVVVTDRHGVPVVGATVDLEPEDGGAPVPLAPQPTSGVLPNVGGALIALGWGPAETSSGGGWRAEGLRPGRYTLRVHAPGYERATVRDVRPGPGRTYFVTLGDKSD